MSFFCLLQFLVVNYLNAQLSPHRKVIVEQQDEITVLPTVSPKNGL